ADELLRKSHTDHVGTMSPQGVACPFPVDSDDQAESTRSTCLHASERILHNHGPSWADAQHLGCLEEGVRRGLSPKVELTRDETIHPGLEQVEDARDPHGFLAVVALRPHRAPYSPLPNPSLP